MFKLDDWDKSLHALGSNMREVSSKVSPGQGADDYLGELDREVRDCEQRILDHLKEANMRLDRVDSQRRPKLKALVYWVSQFTEKVNELVSASARVSIKEHWLKLFRYRYSGQINYESDTEEWLQMINQQKKLKDADKYLSHQHTELNNEITGLERKLSRYDTENFNSTAISCMHTESGIMHAAELNAIEHLETYMRMVEFMTGRSAEYRRQAVEELEKIDQRTSDLLNNCRELALDTLDFDSDSEKIIRKRKFAEYQDQLELLRLKHQKILGILHTSRLKSLHPVLKKVQKRLIIVRHESTGLPA